MDNLPKKKYFDDNHDSDYGSDQDPRDLSDHGKDIKAKYRPQFVKFQVRRERVVKQPTQKRAGYHAEIDEELLCRICKEDTHKDIDCPDRNNPKRLRCGRCKRVGHGMRDCHIKENVMPSSLVSGPASFVPKQQTLEDLYEINSQVGLGIENLLGAQIRVWRNEFFVAKESRKQQQTAHGEFLDLKLNPLLLANITKAGFIHPTPIEWTGIKKMFLYQKLKNCYNDGAKFYKNQMWLTQTGTGKTSTYVIALIELLSRRLKKAELEKRLEEPGKKCRPFAVIIVSIHELAEQIAQTIKMLSAGTQVEASALYGGTHVTNSFLRLTKEKKIVVATMGRLIEFAEAGAFDFSQLEYLIFDEFHEYIDSWKGYNMSQQCNQFLELLGNFTPASSRPYSVIMVSAAHNATLRRIAMRMLSIENLERLPNDQIKVSHSREPQSVFSKQNPLTIISIGVENTVNPNITQKFIDARNMNLGMKFTALVKILGDEFGITDESPKDDKKLFLLDHMKDAGGYKRKILIFVNRRSVVNDLSTLLTEYGYPNVCYHSLINETDRAQNVYNFAHGWEPIMVATNVAANGLDFGARGVSHVINFDLPSASDRKFTYIERLGRTGRAGQFGMATTFFDDRYTSHSLESRWKVLRMAEFLVDLLQRMNLPVPNFISETAQCYTEIGARVMISLPDWVERNEKENENMAQLERALVVWEEK